MATELIGREKVLAKLKAMPAAARTAIKGALKANSDQIVAMQKRLVPVDSGDIRDSIRAEWGDVKLASSANLASGGGGALTIKGDPDLTVTIVAGDEKAFYARFVEFGTSPHDQGGWAEGTKHPGTTPRPFFYGPWRAMRKKSKSSVSRAINKAAKQVAAQ